MKLLCFLLVSGAAWAAPMMRLSNSVVVTAVAAGGSAIPQTLWASNVGDGTLSPSVNSSAPWLSLSVGAAQGCDLILNACIPIQFSFQSSNLAVGTYTARVTVSDPNAIDSPQIVIVTLQVTGPPPPPAIDQYMAPGTTKTTQIPGCSTFFVCNAVASTNDGGPWLAVVVQAVSTLVYTEAVFSPPAGMASGTYTGKIVVGPPVNENVLVTMHLSTLPVVAPSTSHIDMRLAQNGPAMTYPFLPYISLFNSGPGTLEVTDVSGSGSGVTAYNYQGLAIVTVDPGSLAPGTYTDGLVTIQCNAVNCPVAVPVSLEVIPQGPPVVNYQGVQDNASFHPIGSPGDVMVVKGEQLSLQQPQYATGTPLPTTLGGASVLVNGVATPLYYSSFGQMAFQVRSGTYPGLAVVQVIRDGQAGNLVSTTVAPYAPGIVVATDSSYNVIDANHPVKAGQTLVLWSLGLGPTKPTVPDGEAAPANPLAMATNPFQVDFGYGPTVSPSFIGLSPGSVGLYQVTATLPAGTQPGILYVSLTNGSVRSNSVEIAVQ